MDEREARRKRDTGTRARSSHVRPRVAAGGRLATLALSGLVACGGDGAGRDRPPTEATTPTPEAPGNAAPEATHWRFVPTLEQHLPAGAVGEPVLELSQPRQRTVVILAAVLRSKAEHVELERWTFAQTPDGQSLRLMEGGEPMLRLRPGVRSPKLIDLRRELAAPRVVLTRPVGLPGADPRDVMGTLATAFATLRDAKAEPRARVSAAATIVRGLDDTVVFDRDAIWEVAELLAEIPAEIEVETLAERRARAKLPDAGGTATLELQRKSDGWAVVTLERPKPAPPPPSDASSTGSTG